MQQNRGGSAFAPMVVVSRRYDDDSRFLFVLGPVSGIKNNEGMM